MHRKIIFEQSSALLITSNSKRNVPCEKYLYRLQPRAVSASSGTANPASVIQEEEIESEQVQDMVLWHRKLGHIGTKALRALGFKGKLQFGRTCACVDKTEMK